MIENGPGLQINQFDKIDNLVNITFMLKKHNNNYTPPRR